MTEWKPIKTAPKDEMVLLYIPDGPDPIVPGHWCKRKVSKHGNTTWIDNAHWWHYGLAMMRFDFDLLKEKKEEAQPTHWMPLPDCPRDAKTFVVFGKTDQE